MRDTNAIIELSVPGDPSTALVFLGKVATYALSLRDDVQFKAVMAQVYLCTSYNPMWITIWDEDLMQDVAQSEQHELCGDVRAAVGG